MKKIRKDIKKVLNLRNVLVVLIFLGISLLWKDLVTGIVLVAIFVPLTFFSVRYSKMIPHISAESNTAMSCFMGYAFGPVVGFFYALSVGGFSYVMNSFVSITYLSTVLMAGIAAFLAGIFGSLNFSFPNAFIIAIIIRTLVAWPWFTFVGVSPFESFTHQTSQMFFNLIIYLPLLSAFYPIVHPFL